MVRIYRLDNPRLDKFDWPIELISDVKRSLNVPNFLGLDFHVPDLHVYITQKNMVSLSEVTCIYESLFEEIRSELSLGWSVFLEIPLWKAGADYVYSHFKVEHMGGEPHLMAASNTYDPTIIISKTYGNCENERMESVYYAWEGCVIKEVIEVETDLFSPPQDEPLRKATNSYLVVGAVNSN